MRKPIRLLLVLVFAFLLLPTLVVAPAESARPYCGIWWGSLPKVARGDPVVAPISNVRAGRHACFDRLVVDLSGPLEAYRVRYVGSVRSVSGKKMPLRGGADLRIEVWAPTYDSNYVPVYQPRKRANVVRVAGYRTFRQVRFVDSFEGISTFGLGVRARLPFRVFQLSGPGDGSRLVIDVAHRW